jgi:hypothetical protein
MYIISVSMTKENRSLSIYLNKSKIGGLMHLFYQ